MKTLFQKLKDLIGDVIAFVISFVLVALFGLIMAIGVFMVIVVFIPVSAICETITEGGSLVDNLADTIVDSMDVLREMLK